MATNAIVLNTVAASHADLVLSAGTISLTGMSAPIVFAGIKRPSLGVQASLHETVQSYTLSWTLANSTNYSFIVTQKVDGILQTYTFYYTSQTTATNAQIAAAVTSTIGKLVNFHLTASYTSGTSLTITAVASSSTVTAAPLFTLTALEGFTVAGNMAGVAIASNTTATPSVITSVGHGLVTGDVITIVSADEAKLVSGTYRVLYISANTYSLASKDGQTPLAGTSTTTATVTKVAQYARGSGQDLVNAGVTNASASYNYGTLTLDFQTAVTSATGDVARSQTNTLVYYIQQSLVASPYTATTNASTLVTAVQETLHDYVIGGTTAEPILSAAIA